MKSSIEYWMITTLFIIIAILTFRIVYDEKKAENLTATQTETIVKLEEKIEQYRREQDALIYYYTTEQWR